MHEFFGLGTTHFTEVNEDSGAKEVIKLRVHSLLIKLVNGKACVFWKQFMRDEVWLPEDGVGWPVFKENVDLDLGTLTAMPTKPISGLLEVEKRVKVRRVNVGHSNRQLQIIPKVPAVHLACIVSLVNRLFTTNLFVCFRHASSFGDRGSGTTRRMDRLPQ